MRTLVTGGAGFVGSAFVRRVLDTSDDAVTVFDAFTYAGNRANLADLSDVYADRLQIVVGDITDRSAVRAVMEGHEAVVHLAAETHVDRSLADPDVFVRTNCTGTVVVCDEATRVGVDRFLHVSTDEVYGPVLDGASLENDPLRPSSPYAASKAGSDLIALSHHTSFGLPVTVARSANQYGPRQYPEKLIPRSITSLLTGAKLALYGDGRHVRDWLHVDDNVVVLQRLLRHGIAGEIYNVAGHHLRTNTEVAETILDCLGLDWSSVERVADRPGHDRRYAMDTAKVEALGPIPPRPLEAAVADTVRWYVDHRAWWAPLLAPLR